MERLNNSYLQFYICYCILHTRHYRHRIPMPVVTRPSEETRPEPTSAMVTRSRAREARGISVAPAAQIEPEIETRPEQEIATCEGGLGAARPFPTNVPSLFTSSDKPEIVTAHTSQEVTETSLPVSTASQTPIHHNLVNWFVDYNRSVVTALMSITAKQLLRSYELPRWHLASNFVYRSTFVHTVWLKTRPTKHGI